MICQKAAIGWIQVDLIRFKPIQVDSSRMISDRCLLETKGWLLSSMSLDQEDKLKLWLISISNQYYWSSVLLSIRNYHQQLPKRLISNTGRRPFETPISKESKEWEALIEKLLLRRFLLDASSRMSLWEASRKRASSVIEFVWMRSWLIDKRGFLAND